MIAGLRAKGVRLIEHAPVTSADIDGGRVRVDPRRIRDAARRRDPSRRWCRFALAGGMFGLRVAVVPGQGYNVGLPVTDRLRNPVIFEEAHAVATPFADRIRLGGTMEFDGLEPRFDRRRVDAIITSMRRFVDLDYEAHFDTWAGSRPMSPDGLPLMGRPKGFANLVLAAGHGMFGLSLAPVSALALSELIVDGRSSIDLADFDPDRFTFRKLLAG